MIDVIVNRPAFGIGFHALLELENHRQKFLTACFQRNAYLGALACELHP